VPIVTASNVSTRRPGKVPSEAAAGAPEWHKSTFSLANGECVEVADLGGGVIGLRDSKDPDSPVLRFTRAEMNAFLRGVDAGEFNSYR